MKENIAGLLKGVAYCELVLGTIGCLIIAKDVRQVTMSMVEYEKDAGVTPKWASNSRADILNISADNNSTDWICPKCGSKNKKYDYMCKDCGTSR